MYSALASFESDMFPDKEFMEPVFEFLYKKKNCDKIRKEKQRYKENIIKNS